jgi:ribosomal-protein-alanine N-acetyltransferase
MPIFTFDQINLHTERLLLRPLTLSDAPDLYEMRSDPRVMRYHSSTPWQSVELAQALIARDQTAMAEGEYARFGIQRRSDGKFLGSCGLFNLDQQCRRAEIGYELNFSAWGFGYMHEALVRLIAFGFADMNLNRIEADVDPRNAPSVHSLERLGFQKEGHLRERWIVGNEVSDSLLYGLLRSEWIGRSEFKLHEEKANSNV